MWETWIWSLGWKDPLEKGKATHSSILAWRTLWTVSSTGSQRIRHDRATFSFTLCLLGSVQFSRSVTSNSLRPHGLQHARLPCPSPTPRPYSKSFPWSRWCHRAISSSVVPFSSHLQSFPTSESFPVSQFFASDDQSTGVSASASVISMNSQNRFSLGLTGWITFQSKRLSRVFSNIAVQKHQFFHAQLIL